MAITTKASRMSGPDLVAKRLRYGIHAAEIAQQTGLSRQRVSQIEHLFRVPRDMADRYMRALAELAA